MKKIIVLAACSLWLLLGSVAVPVALAGPQLEFGEHGGYFQLDLKGQFYIENTDFGSGPNGTSSRTDMHFQRTRLTVTGMYDEVWGMKFQTCGNCGTTKTPAGYAYSGVNDSNDRDIRIIDAYVIGNFNDAVNMKLGLTKIPLTRANLDDCFAPLSLDRSMYVYSPFGGSAVKFTRDSGVVLWGSVVDDKVKYWIGAFEGREGVFKWTKPGQNTILPLPETATSSAEPKSSQEYVARVHFALLDPEPGSGYEGTYFGKKKILTIGFGAAFEPDAVYSQVSYTAGDITTLRSKETADYTAYAADLMFEYPFAIGTLTISSQYLKADFEDAYKTNANAADRNTIVAGINGQKEGWYAKLAYLLPMTIGKEGQLQPYVLYENWDFAHLLGVNDQTVTVTGVGVNYYIHKQNVRTTLEYLDTEFDTATTLFGITDTTKVKDYQTVRFMFQIVI